MPPLHLRWTQLWKTPIRLALTGRLVPSGRIRSWRRYVARHCTRLRANCDVEPVPASSAKIPQHGSGTVCIPPFHLNIDTLLRRPFQYCPKEIAREFTNWYSRGVSDQSSFCVHVEQVKNGQYRTTSDELPGRVAQAAYCSGNSGSDEI